MLDPKNVSKGEEQYEEFERRLGLRKRKTYVQYDYRDTDGELFSTVKPTLAACREARDELFEWYGVQKICLFDNEMCVVSKYGGKGCDAFSTDDDYLKLAVDEMFRNMLWSDGVYIISGEAEKQELSITLTRGFCIDIRNCTNCGESVFIPSSKVHDLIDAADEYNVEADISSKIAELKNPPNFSEEDLRQMASEIIDRRDDCDIISEAYWQIVEEVIRDFSAEKKQGV